MLVTIVGCDNPDPEVPAIPTLVRYLAAPTKPTGVTYA